MKMHYKTFLMFNEDTELFITHYTCDISFIFPLEMCTNIFNGVIILNIDILTYSFS